MFTLTGVCILSILGLILCCNLYVVYLLTTQPPEHVRTFLFPEMDDELPNKFFRRL